MKVRELSVGLGLAITLALTGCGAVPATDEANQESVGQTQQFITWSPAQHLVDEHVSWHTAPCTVAGQPLSGQAGVGRRCSNTGEDFLIWHRAFLQRLRDEFEAQGRVDDITPWYTVPPEIRSAPGWNTTLEANVQAMSTFINPQTGVRFASLNEYGQFIEGNFHGNLHTISSSLWSVTDPDVGGFTSPRSTLFFKIHGYIDYLFQQFLAGDFNWDGNSDVIARRADTGATRVLYMHDRSLVSTDTITTTQSASDGCNWYVGATADLNFDGHLDLVWHGPGCGQAEVWLMSDTTTLLSKVALPGKASTWTLIGAADYNHDNRPDLFWRHDTTQNLNVWLMNGTNVVSVPSVIVPTGGWRPVLVGDITPDGQPNLFYRKLSSGSVSYGVTDVTGGALSSLTLTRALTSLDPTLPLPKAIGRYHLGGATADLLFEIDPNSEFQLASLTSVTNGSPSYTPAPTTTPISTHDDIEGPR